MFHVLYMKQENKRNNGEQTKGWLMVNRIRGTIRIIVKGLKVRVDPGHKPLTPVTRQP